MRRYKGHIEPYKGGWRVFATIHDAYGRSRRLTKVVRGSRREAERVLARLLDEEGRAPDERFSEVLSAYLEHAQARVRNGSMSPTTYRGYESNVRVHIEPALGAYRMKDLTPVRVNSFLDGLETSRASVYRTLRLVLRWAFRQGLADTDVMARVEPMEQPAPHVGEADVYSAEEVAAILTSPKIEGPFKTAVVIALSCGLRRGEICALDWEDYDGERLSVTKTYGRDRPKTASSRASVEVPGFAREHLGSIRQETGPIVTNMTNDGRMRPDTLSHLWEDLWNGPDPIGVKKLPFKNLRHTSLTLVYAETGDIMAAKERGRHSSVTITDKYYVRAARKADEKAAAAIDEAIGKLL